MGRITPFVNISVGGIINIAFQVLVYLITSRCILSFVRRSYQRLSGLFITCYRTGDETFRQNNTSAGVDFHLCVAVEVVSSHSDTTINDNLKGANSNAKNTHIELLLQQ